MHVSSTRDPLFLIAECRALLAEYRALWAEYRALLAEYRALLPRVLSSSMFANAMRPTIPHCISKHAG